jgi:microcin C transport system permease protein
MPTPQEEQAAEAGTAKHKVSRRKLVLGALVLLYAIPVNLHALFTAQIGGVGKTMVVLVELLVLVALYYFIFKYRPNPLTERKLKNFYAIKRGYNSFVIITVLLLITFFGVGELLVNSRALMVKYEGKLYFPVYGAFHPGADFGLGYNNETDYRKLRNTFKEADEGNWVLMPPVPYNPYENDYRDSGSGESITHPAAPSFGEQHFLGTDNTARDIFARLFYGFRTAMIFALLFLFFVYVIGIATGCAMGYFGGKFDLFFQRLVEIWSNIPFLYIVIIVASIMRPTFGILLGIFVVFSWTSMTYYMRTATYRERERDYTAAARVLGASTPRIIFNHIMPNTISTIVTFMPFTIVSSISSLTALDFLGFGVPPPTPSWGELLKRGLDNLNAPWIVTSAFGGLVIVLILVTFIGEAIREAFDPKKFTTYE